VTLGRYGAARTAVQAALKLDPDNETQALARDIDRRIVDRAKLGEPTPADDGPDPSLGLGLATDGTAAP
jgi:hypothetical protein